MTDDRVPSRLTRRAMVGGTVGLALLSMALAPLRRGSTTQRQLTSAAEKALVFDKVTVVDVETGNLLQDQRVVIEGNRIRAVGASGKVQIPSGVQVIDAHGKYLIPGLWDMHTHSRRYTDFFMLANLDYMQLVGIGMRSTAATRAILIELAMFVTEGFTPLQALQAATINPAKSIHATDSLGTIVPGKLADVVLLDGNPLADITNTRRFAPSSLTAAITIVLPSID